MRSWAVRAGSTSTSTCGCASPAGASWRHGFRARRGCRPRATPASPCSASICWRKVRAAEPASDAVSKRYATRAGLRVGDTRTLAAGGKLHRVEIVALFDPPSPTAAYGLEQVLVADIAVAQELLDMTGRLSRIEAILPAGESGAQAAARLRAQLAPELTLLAADDRRDNLLRLAEAFQLNLKAFSLLALAVGMLLIYNAFTFSVVPRRPMLARLRALG